LRHTVEELADKAEDHHNGNFYIGRRAKNRRTRNNPKPWFCRFGDLRDKDRPTFEGNGDTADEAVREALDLADRAQQPEKML
jgi:hypothetical protein